MDCLYHYCSNDKCFSILKSRSLRLSDIQKSNDYRELNLFFPRLIYEVEDIYKNKPFPFRYNDYIDEQAFFEMTKSSYYYWREQFSSGKFSNYVVCFSEYADSLSQWRGYADNGKGCCLGFSKKVLTDYCNKNNDVLRLEKVEYLSDRQITNRIHIAAIACVDAIRDMRGWIVDNMTYDDNDPDTDKLLHYNFDGFIENVFIDSLQFKSKAFSEEKEWRIFLRKPAYKNPKWICSNNDDLLGPRGFSETVQFLRNRVEFQVTENDLIPYCPIMFDEFSENPVAELWTGPKNNIRESDIRLYLQQNGYRAAKIKETNISYC